jgi:hypothetical protein
MITKNVHRLRQLHARRSLEGLAQTRMAFNLFPKAQMSMGLSDIPVVVSILFWLLFPASLFAFFMGGSALFASIQLAALAGLFVVGIRYIRTKPRRLYWFCFGYPIVTAATNLWLLLK